MVRFVFYPFFVNFTYFCFHICRKINGGKCTTFVCIYLFFPERVGGQSAPVTLKADGVCHLKWVLCRNRQPSLITSSGICFQGMVSALILYLVVIVKLTNCTRWSSTSTTL
ncbi:hypothetical protein GDO81_029992 [Engystomops pustulosus]|uniref:Secreted protein n=1 Tax=Engystomops pustulosus TaxID=76066 RepID=A0AAV6YJJ6_ENGPU|nr:hypothetical protein GDO81_029992 [Engystomops pustulosus]